MAIMNFITNIITRRVKRKMNCIKTPDIEGLREDYERLVESENDATRGDSEEWRTMRTDGKDTASAS